ncbi:MAG TPA: hypothetical protein VII36_09715 [Usitatibacter sp.]
MKLFALIAGAAFLLAGIAAFAGVIALLPVYGIVLGMAGAVFIMYGATRRRELVAPRPGGPDLRDLGA